MCVWALVEETCQPHNAMQRSPLFFLPHPPHLQPRLVSESSRGFRPIAFLSSIPFSSLLCSRLWMLHTHARIPQPVQVLHLAYQGDTRPKGDGYVARNACIRYLPTAYFAPSRKVIRAVCGLRVQHRNHFEAPG